MHAFTPSNSHKAIIPPLLLLAVLLALPASAQRIKQPDMLDVTGGTFIMGRQASESGDNDEFPAHEVTISEYRLAKFEVTNAQYAAILNWAIRRGYILEGKGPVLLNGRTLILIGENTEIISRNGVFAPIMRDGVMVSDHPVANITWFGAATYCNWLSEQQGLDPCYDWKTWELIGPIPNGYRLPTEAEWERAAGWDLTGEPTRWIYGYQGNTPDPTRQNFNFNNPFEGEGLYSTPYTTPVGYFNGENPGTEDSPSPVGAYDMSGNVYEWCNDWYDAYTTAALTDPIGPRIGANLFRRGPTRVIRGGGWGSIPQSSRVSNRGFSEPNFPFRFFGFRLAQNAKLPTVIATP